LALWYMKERGGEGLPNVAELLCHHMEGGQAND